MGPDRYGSGSAEQNRAMNLINSNWRLVNNVGVRIGVSEFH